MSKTWDESKHPRKPAGSPQGGEFTDKSSVTFGARRGTPEELRKLYHVTSPAAAEKILQNGFRTIRALSPDIAKEVYDVDTKDAADHVYFGLSRRAALNNAVGQGMLITIDARALSSRTSLLPDMEGGIAMVKGAIPGSAIIDVRTVGKLTHMPSKRSAEAALKRFDERLAYRASQK